MQDKAIVKAHFFQHVPFEGLGSIKGWLESRGFTISSTPFYDGGDLPVVDEVDFLIIMGGPMSVNDEDKYPWLVDEKRFIGEFIASGKPALGICLGAQLIASALGAKVYPNREKEIGWFPVEPVGHSSDRCFSFPEKQTVFHWHGETFELPPGAVHLARSEACENQAFQLGEKVIGLQCHPETTPKLAKDLCERCADELISAPFVQSEAEILEVGSQYYETANGLMDEILCYLIGGCRKLTV